MIAHANVAKATFYRHFPTKDDLVLTFLRQREQIWVRDWPWFDPEQQLLAIFDLRDE